MALWRARAASTTLFNSLLRNSLATNGATAYRTLSTHVDVDVAVDTRTQFNFDINSQLGRSMPLGAKIEDIEMYPGQGAKLVRSPGTDSMILKEPSSAGCQEKLPSRVEKRSSRAEKWIDSKWLNFDINSQLGRCMPLGAMHIGAKIHNIEMYPGQGAKLVRSPGTYATILKEPSSAGCLVKLPSRVEKWIDSKCGAIIGAVPNGANPGNQPKKLYKAGQSRWLGRRPKVRGMAMNPVDHPMGGGEGKSKGRPSVTPWGKPCKSGYKTGPLKKRR